MCFVCVRFFCDSSAFGMLPVLCCTRSLCIMISYFDIKRTINTRHDWTFHRTQSMVCVCVENIIHISYNSLALSRVRWPTKDSVLAFTRTCGAAAASQRAHTHTKNHIEAISAPHKHSFFVRTCLSHTRTHTHTRTPAPIPFTGSNLNRGMRSIARAHKHYNLSCIF